MLHLILADSELETVPPEIAKHKTIQWQARRRGRRATELVLNSSLHHVAMRRLPDRERRGRPDIVHRCSLLALDTPLNREGLLRYHIHTRGDRVVEVDPKVNLPRAEHRFAGLLEQLYLTGATPPEEPLLRLESSTLADLVERIRPKRTIAFSDRGEPKPIEDAYGELSLDDDACIIIGGFPRGDFRSDVDGLADELVCIDPDLLRAPTVLARAIYAYERAFGVREARLGRKSDG